MKTIKHIALIAALAVVSVSCSKVLEETPHTIFVPSFFNTDAGVEGGINRMYYHLRSLYGGGTMITFNEAGTDEYSWGESAEDSHRIADMNAGDKNWSASQNPASSVWDACFGNINTANGVIENGEANGASPALLAEVRFFRAFDYYTLVTTFGGVPLNLGSGELKFNSAPSRVSYRNTVDEVFDKCIIPDLEYALANLPETPRKTGAVTKTVARLYLAKAYLFYAWWSENPNDIPTYPEKSVNNIDEEGGEHAMVRDKSKANGFFQKALQYAQDGIKGAAAGGYALEATGYDLWKGANKYSKEFLLFADYTQDSEQYGGTTLSGYSGGGAPDYTMNWMVTPNYTNIQFGVDDKGRSADGLKWNNGKAITRAAEQGYGRPWARMAPIHEVFTKTFADQNDQRLDITFMLNYRENYSRYNNKPKDAVVYAANSMAVPYDGVVFKFLPQNLEKGVVKYPQDIKAGERRGASQFGGGEMAGEAAFVVEPNHIGRHVFPGPWKTGIYRTDKSDNAPGNPNSGNFRPLPIARLAELYFVGCEAAIKLGDKDTAYNLILPIRQRAGKANYSVKEAQEVNIDNSAALVAATPKGNDLTIDWLMGEYSREFFMEARRWYDLTRTQTWEKFATTYSMCNLLSDPDGEEHTYTRTIEKKHYMRPIPVGQLNGLEMDDAAKAVYQNPGYEN